MSQHYSNIITVLKVYFFECFSVDPISGHLSVANIVFLNEYELDSVSPVDNRLAQPI